MHVVGIINRDGGSTRLRVLRLPQAFVQGFFAVMVSYSVGILGFGEESGHDDIARAVGFKPGPRHGAGELAT